HIPKLDEAKMLVDRTLELGEAAEEDIKAAAEHEGVSRATLWRARSVVGVQSRKQGFRPGKWYWSLPAAKSLKLPTEESQIMAPPKSLKVSAGQAEIEYAQRRVEWR